MTPTFLPISADPANRKARLRRVEANLRAHRVRRAGGVPCDTCGGAFEGEADVCGCGTEWLGPELEARCWANADVAHGRGMTA